jgi:hypothetical protein
MYAIIPQSQSFVQLKHKLKVAGAVFLEGKVPGQLHAI